MLENNFDLENIMWLNELFSHFSASFDNFWLGNWCWRIFASFKTLSASLNWIQVLMNNFTQNKLLITIYFRKYMPKYHIQLSHHYLKVANLLLSFDRLKEADIMLDQVNIVFNLLIFDVINNSSFPRLLKYQKFFTHPKVNFCMKLSDSLVHVNVS